MTKPDFLSQENMLKLGFEQLSEESTYLKFQNNGTVYYNKDYSKFKEPKGKVQIQLNYERFEKNGVIDIGILQDGGTRTSYYGVCENEEFLISLLKHIR